MSEVASFGAWLQQRRRALGLTQAQLGEQIGIAAATVRKIEADERRPSAETAERLARFLQVSADRSAEFVRWARGETLAAPLPAREQPVDVAWRPHALPPSNLPVPPTPLVGREHEIAALTAMLTGRGLRLLTLTGPGGIGKTRLGLAIAEALRDRFPDGVWFVPLAPIRDARLVLPSIARALGVPEDASLALDMALPGYLLDRDLLLVLDNFEQVLDAAADVSRLLAGVPRLTVLVTSRIRLNIAGEHEFPVPPLAVVNPELLPDLAALSQYAAVELFIQRSQAVKSDWEITSANAPAVADICFRLDGLPLAIELAAARSNVLSPQALQTRLGNRLALLTHGARDLPPRHQTLRATIDWSYNLLDADEQQLFGNMAVFVASVTLEAIMAVCSGPAQSYDQVVDIVASLSDQSMVRMLPGLDDELRCGMFETIREYALERLLASGQIEHVRRRHAEYFCRVAEEYDLELRGAGHSFAMERLEADLPNLRAAVRWAFEAGDFALAIRMMWSLGEYFIARGYRGEPTAQLERVLQSGDEQLAPADRARALYIVARLAMHRADPVAARAYYEASLPLWSGGDDRLGMAWTLNDLGIILWEQDELPGAQAYLDESLQIKRELGDLSDIAITINNLANIAKRQHDFVRAERLLDECITLLAQDPHDAVYPVVLSTMAEVALDQHQVERAAALLKDALPRAHQQRHVLGLSDTLGVLIAVAVHRGDWLRAARYAGLVRGSNEAAGSEFDLSPTSFETFGRHLDTVRDKLGADVYDRCFAEGRALTSDQAIDEVLAYLNQTSHGPAHEERRNQLPS